MTILDLIEEQIHKDPSKKIISFDKRDLNYKQLKEEYEKIASYLHQSGIKRGDIVGLCVNRSIEMVIALLAILKCGAIYLPIDPSFPAKRIELILDDSNCHFLVSESGLYEKFNSYNGKLIDINRYEINNNYNTAPDINVGDNDIAYIIYTSGSTGVPKGVQIAHSSLLNLLISVKDLIGINDNDSFLAISTLSFDISLVELLLPLISRARLVIAMNEEVRDGYALLNILRDKITIFQATPATWKMLNDSGWTEKLHIKAISTGEALPRDLADKIIPKVKFLWNMYGPTETTIFSSGSQVDDNGIIHLGKPINDTQFYIVDKHNQLCAPGVTGELLIGGAGLSVGYLNNDKLTDEKFISNPFDKSGQSKVYRTGDLVRLTFDKKIEYLGRIDNQVKIRGYRIELGEIETEIKKNNFINDCVAVVKEFDRGDKRIIAFFIPNGISNKNINDDQELHVERWKDSYDNMYVNAFANLREMENTKPEIGYLVVKQFENNSDFRDQFKVWIDETTKRIRELKPDRVLEIGCGGGDILKRIMDECSFYCATDLSPRVIEYLENELNKIENTNGKIKLYTLPADADIPYKAGSFNTVIMNSVVAYFPNEIYLINVIKKLISKLDDNGSFFVGDVQSFSLMKNQYIFEQLSRIPKSTSIGDFKQIISNRLRTTPEFFVDPDYFYSLTEKVNRINRVEVKLMRGSINNDPTVYHYDVILYTKSKIVSKNLMTLNWESPDKSLKEITAKLKNLKPEILHVQDIPNKRIQNRRDVESAIENAQDDLLVSDIVASANSVNNEIDPEEIWKLEDELEYRIDLILPPKSDQTKFDAVFIRRNIDDNITYPLLNPKETFKSIGSYCNKPFLKLSDENLIEKIRQDLHTKLPEYMRPAHYIQVESFPLTPSGKIDRKTLGLYEVNKATIKTKSSKPVTSSEKLISGIWENILGLSEIGIDDNFFELGGHSILAAQMFTEIEQKTGKRIPIATLFKLQTIRELAKLIDKPEWTPDWSPLVEIKKGKNGFPLFLVHGAEGNILIYREISKYLDNDQGLYGIQSPGLNRTDLVSASIEEMSREYINAIKSVQPDGPYNLGGYCMGGTIAYEMAQQLVSRGDQVNLLLLIETYNVANLPIDNTISTKINLSYENLKFHLANFLSLEGTDRIAFFRSKWAVAKTRAAARSKHILQKILSTLHVRNNEPQIFISIRETNHTAHNKYKPAPYFGNTILLKPSRNFSSESDPDFGWRELIKGDFKVYSLDLAPRGMLVEPYVKETARIVSMELNLYNK